MKYWLRVPDRILALLTVWLLGMGLLTLLMASGFWLVERHAVRGDVRAVGTIADNVPGEDAAGKIVYAPRVRFRAADGTLVYFIAADAADSDASAVGETVPVLYPVGHPGAARLGTRMKVYPVACVLGWVGMGLFDLGGFCWIAWYRRGRPRKTPKSRRAFGRTIP